MSDTIARGMAGSALGRTSSMLPEGKLCLTHGDNLRDWRSKLSRAQFRQTNIAVFGNSLTDGAYCNDTASENQAVYRERGWVPQLRSRFRSAVLPAVGEGLIGFGDARITSSGTLSIPSTGITRATGGSRINNTGQSITLVTTDPCNEVWVHGWWESDAKCAPFVYTVDGGADQTASAVNALGSDKDYTFKITGLSSASHTIVIKPAATPTKQIDIAGFSVFLTDGASKGVAVHRAGRGGGYIDNFFYLAAESANPRSSRLTFGRLGVDLVILQFFNNESGTNGESVGWAPGAQSTKNYYTFTKDVVDQITGTYGCDVVLATLTRRQSSISTYGEQAFVDVHARIASENSRCAHFDLALSPRWATYATAAANGLMQDGVHPNLAGHSDIARLVYEAIT